MALIFADHRCAFEFTGAGRVTLNFGVLLHCSLLSKSRIKELHCVCSAKYTVHRTSFPQNWANFFFQIYSWNFIVYFLYTTLKPSA